MSVACVTLKCHLCAHCSPVLGRRQAPLARHSSAEADICIWAGLDARWQAVSCWCRDVRDMPDLLAGTCSTPVGYSRFHRTLLSTQIITLAGQDAQAALPPLSHHPCWGWPRRPAVNMMPAVNRGLWADEHCPALCAQAALRAPHLNGIRTAVCTSAFAGLSCPRQWWLQQPATAATSLSQRRSA